MRMLYMIPIIFEIPHLMTHDFIDEKGKEEKRKRERKRERREKKGEKKIGRLRKREM